MLDPWIIEQIRRREEDRRRREQPVLELPVPEMPMWPTRNNNPDEEETPADDAPKRGVVIIGM